MVTRFHALAALAACTLSLAAALPAKADVIINYDFSTAAAAGTTTPTTIGPATFSSPSDPGAFTFGSNGGLSARLGASVLSSLGTVAELDIAFSTQQDAISFDFLLGNFLAAGDTLTVTTFEGKTQVGSETAISSLFGTDFFPTGSADLAGGPFDHVEITSADPIVIADLSTTQMSEPGSLAMLGLGLVGLIVARRRRA